MRKLIYILLFTCISLCKVSAQEVYEKLNLDVALGGEGYINDWESGEITDGLLSPSDFSFNGKIRLNYYFHKHWGVHGDFTLATYRGSKNKKDVIPSGIASLYERDYYLVNPHLITDKTFVYMRFLAGVQYRWERRSWSLIPRISFGFSHIPVDHCSFTLKGKGNNEQYLVEYYTKGNKNAEYGLASRLLLNPGIQVGYKLNHVHFTLEVGYMQFLNKLRYEFEKTELYLDGEHLIQEIPSKHTANKYNFNVGVCIPLSWKVK